MKVKIHQPILNLRQDLENTRRINPFERDLLTQLKGLENDQVKEFDNVYALALESYAVGTILQEDQIDDKSHYDLIQEAMRNIKAMDERFSPKIELLHIESTGYGADLPKIYFGLNVTINLPMSLWHPPDYAHEVIRRVSDAGILVDYSYHDYTFGHPSLLSVTAFFHWMISEEITVNFTPVMEKMPSIEIMTQENKLKIRSAVLQRIYDFEYNKTKNLYIAKVPEYFVILLERDMASFDYCLGHCILNWYNKTKEVELGLRFKSNNLHSIKHAYAFSKESIRTFKSIKDKDHE